MLPDIENLLKLQDTDKEIRRLQDEVAEFPKRVAVIEQKLAGTKAQLERAQAAVKADEAARRKYDTAIADLRGKISKYRDQSLDVKTNDQYKALLHEIQFAEKEIAANEDKILEMMVNADVRDKEVKAAQAELKAETAEIEKENEKGNERITGYTPIPNSRFGNAFRPLMNGPQYKQFLEQVAARFATQPNQAFWLRGLFWSIGSIDATSLCVIDELVHRGDKDSVRDALQLIGGAPPELALSRPHFAVHVIEESRRVDAQLGVSAESILLTNAQTGPFNRASGQPSPKYLSMKERSARLSELFPQGSSGTRLFTRLREVAVEMLNRERLDDEQMGFE